MPSKVFFGTARQALLEAKETLPAKLDLILEQLHLRDRVDKETVPIKMHTGNNMVYSTIHPVFVRRVVQAIKDGGGKPIVVDVNWDTAGAEQRGYASEVIGCPVYPAAGPDGKYFYEHERPYKSIQSWRVGGLIQDASFLVNFAHVKGHPSCGFGAALTNLALGCLAGKTRGAMHDAGGGALLREKVLAQATRRNIIIVVESKLAPRLGTKWALPVEVVPFARPAEERFIASMGAAVTLRSKDGRPVATDQGNLLLDAAFGPMENPAAIAEQLNGRAGIVEHGLFLGLARDVIVAGRGGIRHLTRQA